MTLKKLDEARYSIPTRLIYGRALAQEWDYSHHVIPPITASSTFRLDSTLRGAQGFQAIATRGARTGMDQPIYVYDRMGEPMNDMLQHGLATAEEGQGAVTFATGMAAVSAAVSFALETGSEIISHKTVYGCTYSLFTDWMPRFGMKVHFADLTNPENILALINPKTRVLYLESPVNPNLELLDLQRLCALLAEVNKTRAPEQRIYSVIDNTFSTPYCQRPLNFGVDVVAHSLTKGISGFGTDMGGAVITRLELLDKIYTFRKDFGGMLAPQTAWHIYVYGLSTLALRVPRQQENAIKVAQFLEQHAAVDLVRYPGLESFPQYEVAKRHLLDYRGAFAPGFMVYFTLKGRTPEESRARGQRMMDFVAQNAYTVTLAVSLGQLRTLIEHPASMTHAAYPADQQVKKGIDPGGIRLAVGIEDGDDIIADLDRALKAL